MCIFFFIFTTIFLSKQTNRMFQLQCRWVPWKSLECKQSPVVELSLCWVTPLLPHLTFSSVCAYRCSTVSWGIPKTAVSMAMDLREVEQWLLLWACDFPCWTQESNPGHHSVEVTPVASPEAMHRAEGLCSLPRDSPTVTGLPWPSKSCCGYLTWQLKAFRSMQNQFICRLPKALGSLSTTTVPEGLNSTT